MSPHRSSGPAMVALVSLLGAGLSSSPAHAAPNEEVVQLVTHPTAPERMVLRYQFSGGGLFLSQDAGATWSVICNSAIQAGLRNGGPLAMAADGKLFMALFDGMLTDDGTGCGWQIDPTLAQTWTRDVVAHPSDPQVLYAITSTAGADGDEPANGLRVREGSGPWTELGSQDPVLIHRLHVVELGDGLRFYQSAQRSTPLADGRAAYITRHSDDQGASWTSYDVGPVDRIFRLFAVDPSDPDRLLGCRGKCDATSAREQFEPDTLMVSLDRGETWSDYGEVANLSGVAFAPDGRVWLGDAGDLGDSPRGLWYAEDLASPPIQLMDDRAVSCLHHRQSDDSLFICQQFVAGALDLETLELEESFDITKVETFATCPGQDMQASCRDQMLRGYCGVTHFPCTPVCAPYDVDLSVLEGGCDGDDVQPTPDAGLGGSGGTAAMSGAGGTGMAGSGGTASAGGNGGAGPRVVDPPPDPGDSSDGGCRAGRPAGSNSTSGLALALLWLLWRRRR